MSRKKKVITIIHLCFAFSYFSWLLIQPYAKEIIAQKSELSLFEKVLEHPNLFQALPDSEQLTLLEGYEHMQTRESPSFFKAIGHLFFVATPPFALAWLFFSILICLFLLFRIEGASQSAWFLPFFVLAFAYFSYKDPPSQQLTLFPSENYVVSNYLDNDEGGFFERHKRLLLGWHRYLIIEWAHEEPSSESALFEKQLDKGLFAFNVERLKWIVSGQKDELILAGFALPPSYIRIFFYFVWNFLFAWYINRKEKQSPSEAASSQNYSM